MSNALRKCIFIPLSALVHMPEPDKYGYCNANEYKRLKFRNIDIAKINQLLALCKSNGYRIVLTTSYIDSTIADKAMHATVEWLMRKNIAFNELVIHDKDTKTETIAMAKVYGNCEKILISIDRDECCEWKLGPAINAYRNIYDSLMNVIDFVPYAYVTVDDKAQN